MATRLTHIALQVDALEECIGFYERYCRLNVAEDQERGSNRIVLLAESEQESGFVIQRMGGVATIDPQPLEKRATSDSRSTRVKLWIMQLRRAARMESLSGSRKTFRSRSGTTAA